jgi:Iron-binding zinc finger CDGSH type
LTLCELIFSQTFSHIHFLTLFNIPNIMAFDSKKIEALLEEPVVLAMIMIPILIIVIQSMFESVDKRRRKPINLTYKKREPKVVDKVDCGEIEAIAEFKDGKLVMCRCWRSKTFPYCDGSFRNQ